MRYMRDRPSVWVLTGIILLAQGFCCSGTSAAVVAARLTGVVTPEQIRRQALGL